MLKTPAQLADEARRSIPEISVQDVRAGLEFPEKLGLLLDVREHDEHAAGAIPGAVPMPRGVIEMQIPKVTQDENAPIVCYCGGGTRSLFAAEQLKRMGYTNVRSMAGGFRAWKDGNFPIRKP